MRVRIAFLPNQKFLRINKIQDHNRTNKTIQPNQIPIGFFNKIQVSSNRKEKSLVKHQGVLHPYQIITKNTLVQI